MTRFILIVLLGVMAGCGPSQKEFDMLRAEVDGMRLMLEPREGVITARSVYILDSSGRQRAVLGTTRAEEGSPHESPLLTFLDAKGRKRFFLLYSDALHEGAIGAFGLGGEVISYETIGSLDPARRGP